MAIPTSRFVHTFRALTAREWLAWCGNGGMIIAMVQWLNGRMAMAACYNGHILLFAIVVRTCVIYVLYTFLFYKYFSFISIFIAFIRSFDFFSFFVLHFFLDSYSVGCANRGASAKNAAGFCTSLVGKSVSGGGSNPKNAPSSHVCKITFLYLCTCVCVHMCVLARISVSKTRKLQNFHIFYSCSSKTCRHSRVHHPCENGV